MKETIKELEKEIKEIEKKDLGKDIPLKKEVVEHINLTLEYCGLKAKLQTLQKVCREIQFAFNICSNSMLDIVKEKPRDNNTPRDWEQRIDELILLYSSLNGLSNNEAKEELLEKFKGEE